MRRTVQDYSLTIHAARGCLVVRTGVHLYQLVLPPNVIPGNEKEASERAHKTHQSADCGRPYTHHCKGERRVLGRGTFHSFVGRHRSVCARLLEGAVPSSKKRLIKE